MYRRIREISRYFSSVARQKNTEAKKSFPYTVRSIRSEDIPDLVELSRENFFQYPVSNLKYWCVHDPDGIQVAVNESGKVVGVCSTVKVNENLYFGGLFMVQEKCRDADIGRKEGDIMKVDPEQQKLQIRHCFREKSLRRMKTYLPLSTMAENRLA
ncbi:unnamed protein product [Larinioides sclopetarius]|uniref:N-acetyltransferase domain-containing protein n=1 Tax=Larinioides sclopetarius TaxID=280406 RepID=A0AAV1ZF23_9ARAC